MIEVAQLADWKSYYIYAECYYDQFYRYAIQHIVSVQKTYKKCTIFMIRLNEKPSAYVKRFDFLNFIYFRLVFDYIFVIHNYP